MDARNYPEAYLEEELISYGTRNHVLDKAAKRINDLEKQQDELKSSLERIVSYYDLAKSRPLFPSLTDQAKSEHENTMFGEARSLLRRLR